MWTLTIVMEPTDVVPAVDGFVPLAAPEELDAWMLPFTARSSRRTQTGCDGALVRPFAVIVPQTIGMDPTCDVDAAVQKCHSASRRLNRCTHRDCQSH
jgi:hypothetical protein